MGAALAAAEEPGTEGLVASVGAAVVLRLTCGTAVVVTAGSVGPKSAQALKAIAMISTRISTAIPSMM